MPFAERGVALRGLLDLATGCYPAFLFGGSLRGVLPVFHFHEVTREGLEPRLQYLAENDYRTVTCDEVARLVVNGVDPGPRGQSGRAELAILKSIPAVCQMLPEGVMLPQFGGSAAITTIY